MPDRSPGCPTTSTTRPASRWPWPTSAGDLVFWGTTQTDWTTVYHTAIYVGGGRIVEATGDQVQLNSLYQWGTAELMPIGRHP